MADFCSQLRAHLTSPVRILAALSTSVLLGITGPFGTFVSLGFFERFLYWSSIVIVSIVVVQVLKVAIDIKYLHLSQTKKALIVAVLSTVVLSPILSVLTDLVVDEGHGIVTPLWYFASLIFSITVLVILFQHLMGFRTFRRRPRLFERFDDKQVNRIFWITVRDHYVDVHTNRGKETLLMRFSDALAELDDMDGLQVHRSHWVASHAVASYQKENGRGFIRLRDGTEVPVSRGYQTAAEQHFN